MGVRLVLMQLCGNIHYSMIRKFIEIFVERICLNSEYDELFALVTPTIIDFVAGQYTLATECMEFDTFDFVTKVEHVQLVRLCRKRVEKRMVDFLSNVRSTKRNARPHWRQSKLPSVLRHISFSLAVANSLHSIGIEIREGRYGFC